MSFNSSNYSYILTVISLMIIDLLLLARLEKDRRLQENQRWIGIMFISCAACALSDALCVLFNQSHVRFLVYISNALFDFSFTFVSFFLFYHTEQAYNPGVYKNKLFNFLVHLPIVVCGILLLLSYKYGIIFAVDELGNYTRGPLYNFFYICLACIYIIVFVFMFIVRMLIVKDKSKIDILKATFNYYFPLIAGSGLQLFFIGFPGSNMGLTLTMIYIFFDGLEEQIKANEKDLKDTNDELIDALDKADFSSEVISSISKLYLAIYSLNLDSGIMMQIRNSNTYFAEGLEIEDAQNSLNAFIKNEIVDDYKALMYDFYNLSTLRDRLKDLDNISLDYRTRDDRWINSRFIVQNRNNNGDALDVLLVPSLITKEKQRELEYQEQIITSALETKKANMAKTDFLRRMSHDIRTPINGVLGLINIGDHYDDDIVKQRECRQKVKEASCFLLDLVNNILDMNKLESGAVILEEKSFDLNAVLKELYDIACVNGNENSITVSIDELRVKHNHLIGSPLHLRQILMNIVGNAIKYNKPNGSVVLSCKEIEANDNVVKLEFVCKDSGLGMSEEFKKRAFEPFVQANQDARSSYSGTGLGLAITKQLVELMGGELSLESELDVGTTFTYVQSFVIDNEYKEANKEVDEVSLRGKKILIVEDNELNMEISKFVFEQKGGDITCAYNGKQALDIFKASKPYEYDLILMDIMMPVMDGYTATKQIRNLDRVDNNVLIFAMSANAFVEDKRESKKAGMNEHLSKPLIDKDINDALRKYLK